MATWSLTAQLTSGTLVVNPTDHVWWNSSTYGTNIIVGGYQDSTHITDASDVHRCTTNHVNNTKFIDGSHASINGAGSSALPIGTGSCGLIFNFSDASANATSAGSFYAYDGTTDLNPMLDVNFQAAEGGQSSSWITANGSGSALTLADQTSSTSHNFYVATSVSPTSNGAKTGKVKILLTYV